MNDFAPPPPPPVTIRRRPRTWLRLTATLLVVALVAAGLVWFQYFKAGILKQVVANIRSEVPTVATAVASTQPWQPSTTSVGTARASNGADLAAEIGGVVDHFDFESGQNVAAGAELLRLRPNDDAAKLAQLQANAELANVTLQRDQKQLAVHGVAQATVDADAANLKVTRAQVAAQQLDPMFVDFWLPQQALGQIATGQTVQVTADAWPGRTFPGRVSSLNSRIDAASRMLQIRASIPNADGTLLPGMFVDVSIANGQPRPLVTIPAAAVAFNPYGSLVYVVHDEKDAKGADQHVVKQQFVTTGAARGDQVSILKGVAANDVVVTAGQLKLHNGSIVKIDNAVRPTDDPAPVPVDR